MCLESDITIEKEAVVGRKTKIIIILLLSFFLTLTSASISYSQYVTIQLTDNAYDERDATVLNNGFTVWRGYDGTDYEIYLYDGEDIIQITNDENDSGFQTNVNGYIVWGKSDGNDSEIFLYNGSTTTQITNNSYYDVNPKINSNGSIVWQGYDGTDYEIYLYDGEDIIQITDDSYDDRFPQINDNGYVVWRKYAGDFPCEDIFLYDGASVSQIAVGHCFIGAFQIINNGYVVWDKFDGTDFEIYLYNWVNTIQITDDSCYNFFKINNAGYIVWQADDGSDWEIYLYNGTNTTQLTNNSYDDAFPQINDNGYVVWEGSDGSDYEIFLYNGSTTTQITNNSYGDIIPQINNNGYIVWQGYDGTDSEIYLYDGKDIIQITDNSYEDFNPRINDSGYIIWYGYKDGSDSEIFIAAPEEFGVPNIRIIPTSYDFGQVSIMYQSAPQTFTISNRGATSLNIGNITLTGDNKSEFSIQNDNCSGSNVAPFGMCTLQVILLPMSEGLKSAALSIPSNDPDTPVLNVPLSGTGVECSQITLLKPNGGEVIDFCSAYNIRWCAPPEAVEFKILYSTDNELTWNLIAENIKSANYDWQVPKLTKNKKKCFVKVKEYDVSGNKVGVDASDEPFTIEVVRLTSPTGGESLISGTTYPITWITHCTKRPIAKVKLYYTKDGGVTWNLIGAIKGSNPGSYDWQVPWVGMTKNKCKVKVKLKDESGNSIGIDVSDDYFIIPFRSCDDVDGDWVGTTPSGYKIKFILSQNNCDVTGIIESPGSCPGICGMFSGPITGSVIKNIFSFKIPNDPWVDCDTCEILCYVTDKGNLTIEGNTMYGPVVTKNCAGTKYSIILNLTRSSSTSSFTLLEQEKSEGRSSLLLQEIPW